MSEVIFKTKTPLYIRNLVQYLFLSIIALVFILPLWWITITSLKLEGNVLRFPPSFIPDPLTFENYATLLRRFNFGIYTLNSLKVSVLGMIGQLLSCSLAAFAFARLKFPGKSILFIVLISTMMIPEQVTLIPTFLIFKNLGLYNTHAALILPDFLGKAFGIFLLRQFFMTLPKELEEAARMDGCGTFKIYARIFMPLAKPALATLAIFSFMGQWNDLLRPVIYLSESGKRTLTIAMSLFQNQQVIKWALMMGGAVVCIVPLLILFIFTQRYFIAGISSSGIKG